MTEKSSLTASAVASILDANVNFIQGPCRAAGINAFKAQCIPPAQLVVLIMLLPNELEVLRFTQNRKNTKSVFVPTGLTAVPHIAKARLVTAQRYLKKK